MPNNIFGVSACCGCSTSARNCEEPGNFYDDFSTELEGWAPEDYYDDYVDQVNDRLDTSTYFSGIRRCMESGGIRDGWSLVQEAEFYTGTNEVDGAALIIDLNRAWPGQVTAGSGFIEFGWRWLSFTGFWYNIYSLGGSISNFDAYDCDSDTTYVIRTTLAQTSSSLGVVNVK